MTQDSTEETGGAPTGDSTSTTGDDSKSTTPVRVSPPRRVENELFYELASVHPLSEFDEIYFLDLLEHSLSLSVSEKKRVIDAIPTLSQFQVDELHKVFEDEREEFKKLLSKEGDVIRDLVIKSKEGWDQLRGMYQDEQKEFEKEFEDQAKLDEINALLDDAEADWDNKKGA